MPPKLTLNSPIDGSLLFEGALTAADELPALGQRARDAFRSWRKVPLSNRKAICTRWCDLLVQRKEELGRELTLQMGRRVCSRVSVSNLII